MANLLAAHDPVPRKGPQPWEPFRDPTPRPAHYARVAPVFASIDDRLLGRVNRPLTAAEETDTRAFYGYIAHCFFGVAARS